MKELLKKEDLPGAIVVDSAHKNKDPGQMEVVLHVAQQIQMGEVAIKGVMIESNLVAGQQEFEAGKTDLETLERGKSITDACVDLNETETMFKLLSGAVLQRRMILKNQQ